MTCLHGKAICVRIIVAPTVSFLQYFLFKFIPRIETLDNFTKKKHKISSCIIKCTEPVSTCVTEPLSAYLLISISAPRRSMVKLKGLHLSLSTNLTVHHNPQIQHFPSTLYTVYVSGRSGVSIISNKYYCVGLLPIK